MNSTTHYGRELTTDEVALVGGGANPILVRIAAWAIKDAIFNPMDFNKIREMMTKD